MKGILCVTSAKNNEEYRVVIKKRIIILIVVMIFGAITASAGFVAEFYGNVVINERMLGVYTGTGTGLFFASLAIMIKNRILLRSEERLKASRLNNSDERIKEIRDKAFNVSAYALIAALYLVAFVGGLFYPVLVVVLLIVLSVFLLTYVIAFTYYNHKM
ncbi:MAG: hypothetical protein WBI07_11210 [Mobilitalea sp.]